MHAQHFANTAFAVFLVLSGILGILAMVSPKFFQALATRSTRWIDTERYLAVLDRRVDVDAYVLQHCRVLGALVMVSVSVLGYLWIAR